MKVPTPQAALQLLEEAHARNPGLWADHCRVAGESARAIAAQHPALDPDCAYVMGLLHDIGRGAGGPGVADVRHVMDGYRLLLDRGFDDYARICLTHSFPIKQTDAFASPWDCPPAEKQFVQDYLDRVEYTAYDRLIQVCDSLALPYGPCLMEKRLVDVALRHGFNALTIAKWQAFLALRQEFDAVVGGSIYTLLTDVVDNTFGFAADAPVPPRLVIFSGAPGTGKTTLAEYAAESLGAPLFSKDELEATLWRSSIRRDANSGWAAYELLTTLAARQLRLGQSAILDSVATLERIRAPWRALAAEFSVPLRIVEATCSDGALHRVRLKARQRGIPGWPEPTWPEVAEVAEKFEPWTDDRLVLDAAEPLDQNLRALRAYLFAGEPEPRRLAT